MDLMLLGREFHAFMEEKWKVLIPWPLTFGTTKLRWLSLVIWLCLSDILIKFSHRYLGHISLKILNTWFSFSWSTLSLIFKNPKASSSFWPTCALESKPRIKKQKRQTNTTSKQMQINLKKAAKQTTTHKNKHRRKKAEANPNLMIVN